jgi:hypothetical protein
MNSGSGNICNKLTLTIVHFFNYLSSKNIQPIKKVDADIFKDEEEPIWF